MTSSLAEVRDYDGLIAALRARKEALQISNETVERMAGWPDRYAAKVLGDVRSRGLSPGSMLEALAALGLGLQIVEVMTAEQLAVRFGDKFTPCHDSHVRKGRASKLAKLGQRALKRAFPVVVHEIAVRGGKARMASMTKRQLTAHQRRAGKARWRQT